MYYLVQWPFVLNWPVSRKIITLSLTFVCNYGRSVDYSCWYTPINAVVVTCVTSTVLALSRLFRTSSPYPLRAEFLLFGRCVLYSEEL